MPTYSTPLAGFDPSVAALRLRLLKAAGHPEEARTAAALALEHTAD